MRIGRKEKRKIKEGGKEGRKMKQGRTEAKGEGS
jgi:hypothetical protein